PRLSGSRGRTGRGRVADAAIFKLNDTCPLPDFRPYLGNIISVTGPWFDRATFAPSPLAPAPRTARWPRRVLSTAATPAPRLPPRAADASAQVRAPSGEDTH